MVKFIALYQQPEDPTAFDEYYQNVHLPLCHKIPNLLKVEIARVTGTPRGPSNYYMMVSLYFQDEATMMAALTSEAGMATAKDARNFAKEIFSGHFAVCEEITVTNGVIA